MKKTIFVIIFFSFLVMPMFQVMAQDLNLTGLSQDSSDSNGFPQWVKDLRRWEIIAFGTFPFSLVFTSFAMDMIRWNNENGMDFSSEGRRYAPWPFKPADAVAMSSDEFRRTLFIAAGVSMTAAFVDWFIVRTRRNNERRRIESLPSGIVGIDRRPIEIPPDEEKGYEIGAVDGDAE